MASQKLNIDIIARDKTKQALGGIRGALGRLKSSIFSVQSAFVGLGAGLVARNLVNTGKELENLRVRLKFLLKDTNEGAKAFDNMVKFASRVPFSLEEIQAGSGILATVTDNAEDLQNMLEITGNVAAVTGLDFRTASEQIQRSFSAGIGAADLFREKGVRNMLGFKAGATVSIEETVEAFERVFGQGGRFGKSTDELARTFQGTLSMIGDKIFNFKKVLLEAGLFEELKKQFGSLDKFLEDNAKELDKIAISVGQNLARGMSKVVQIGKDLIPTLQKIGSVLRDIADGFMSLPPFVRTGGIIGAFLFGRKGMAALAGVSFLIDKINDMISDMKISMGIFDMDNIDHVNTKIAQIKKQIEDIQTPDFLSNLGDTSKTDKQIKKEQEKLDKLLQQLEVFEKQKKFLEETVDLRAGNLPILRDEMKTYERIFKEKEKIEQSTARELGIIKNQNEQLTGFEHILRRTNNEALENLRNKFNDIKTTIIDGLNSGISSFSNALSRAIVLGEDLGKSFKKMVADALVNTLALFIEIIIRMGIQKLLGIDLEKGQNRQLNNAKKFTRELQKQVVFATILAFLTGGASMAPTGGRQKAPGDGMAKGGAVFKGQPVLVGERGPEMFVPNSTGQIEQSARGTDRNGTILNFNITATDVRGVKELLVDNRATIVNVINSALNEKGREALV